MLTFREVYRNGVTICVFERTATKFFRFINLIVNVSFNNTHLVLSSAMWSLTIWIPLTESEQNLQAGTLLNQRNNDDVTSLCVCVRACVCSLLRRPFSTSTPRLVTNVNNPLIM